MQNSIQQSQKTDLYFLQWRQDTLILIFWNFYKTDLDHFFFFLFFIVGYLARLPRSFRLIQDSLKIVGSSHFPGTHEQLFNNRLLLASVYNLTVLLKKLMVPSYSPSQRSVSFCGAELKWFLQSWNYSSLILRAKKNYF